MNQRWAHGRDSYRPVGEPIQTRLFEVGELDEFDAKGFVIEHHYSRSHPAARWRFGMHRAGRLVGVAVFSHPCRDSVLTDAFPAAAPREAVELGRFMLLDEVPGNGETWFLGRCFAALRGRVRGVLSTSDPVARAALDGRVIFPAIWARSTRPITRSISAADGPAPGGEATPHSYASEAEAEAAVRAFTREFGSGIDVGSALERWKADVTTEGLKPITVVTMMRKTRQFLTPAHHLALTETKRFLRWCVAQKLLKADPSAKIDRVGKPRRGRPKLRVTESRRLVDVALAAAGKGDDSAVAIMIALVLGRRASETSDLELRDVDDDGALLWVADAKTDAGKVVIEIPLVMRPVLNRLVAARAAKKQTRLFPGRNRHWSTSTRAGSAGWPGPRRLSARSPRHARDAGAGDGRKRRAGDAGDGMDVHRSRRASLLRTRHDRQSPSRTRCHALARV
jgi:integrase